MAWWAVAEKITAAKLNTTFPLTNGPTWSSYTAALTASSSNPTLGSGSNTAGRYTRIGDLVVIQVEILFGSSGAAAGSGTYSVSVPTGLDIASSVETDIIAGTAELLNSGTRRHMCLARRSAATTVSLMAESTGGTVTHASPFAWTNNDAIQLLLTYEMV
jgi:hypothetical protein